MENTNALLIPIKNDNHMQRAIVRAKQHHPKVSIINAAQRVYRVSGSRGDQYTVQFFVANGVKLGRCNCEAGKNARVCYHLASAAAVNMGLAWLRERAEYLRRNAVLIAPTIKGEKYDGIDI